MNLRLPRTVIVLSAVSFLNDAASEMITPLLPLFLTMTLGAGPAVVGLVEGVAEATASLLKLLSGWLADRGWNSKRLVLGGYTLSNTARPLIGLALGWGWVLVLRFLDRVGKGVRTSPRDAMIAAATGASRRGRAFGFHRALDNGGAVLGPLVAFVLLQAQMPVAHVFLWSVIPGLLVLTLLRFGLPPAVPAARLEVPPRLRWRVLDARLRGLIFASGGLALAAVPEAFLVLWAHERGLALMWVPLVWSAASAVKALVAMPAGCLSDRVGRVPVLALGWSARGLILLALACNTGGIGWTWALFLSYVACLAFTEGAERALIGDRAPVEHKGTAFGLYHMVTGLAALPGGVLFGVIWQLGSAETAFATAAAVVALSLGALLSAVFPKNSRAR